MIKFQFILILLLFLILFSFFKRFRKPAIDKIVVGLILISGIFFAFYPETTNKMAHYLGIGRGADLIFYLAILGFGYGMLLLYSKVKTLEDQLAAIVRKQSLDSVNLSKKNG
jgi:small membrane protein